MCVFQGGEGESVQGRHAEQSAAGADDLTQQEEAPSSGIYTYTCKGRSQHTSTCKYTVWSSYLQQLTLCIALSYCINIHVSAFRIPSVYGTYMYVQFHARESYGWNLP